MQLKWSVSISGGNGAGGVDTNYGGVPGFCGDTFEGAPPKSTFVGLPCDPQETYQAGGIMSMQIDIAANHGGFFEVSVCDSKDISQACFDKNKLKTCAFISCEEILLFSHMHVIASLLSGSLLKNIPSDAADLRRLENSCFPQSYAITVLCRVSHDAEQWHIMDRKLDSPTDKRPDSYFMDWKIPAGLTCGHCVVMVRFCCFVSSYVVFVCFGNRQIPCALLCVHKQPLALQSLSGAVCVRKRVCQDKKSSQF